MRLKIQLIFTFYKLKLIFFKSLTFKLNKKMARVKANFHVQYDTAILAEYAEFLDAIKIVWNLK